GAYEASSLIALFWWSADTRSVFRVWDRSVPVGCGQFQNTEGRVRDGRDRLLGQVQVGVGPLAGGVRVVLEVLDDDLGPAGDVDQVHAILLHGLGDDDPGAAQAHPSEVGF